KGNYDQMMVPIKRLIIPQDPSNLNQKDSTIHTDAPFFKFQTVKEVIRDSPVPIAETEYRKGVIATRIHEMCLQCLGDIDWDTCRTVNDGWGIAWHCDTCGYLKKSHEMVLIFLRGAADKHYLNPSQINKYKVRVFPWAESPRENDSIMHIQSMYTQVACLTQQGGMEVREALGDADFFAKAGIFDILARAWLDEKYWQLVAIRIQDSIWISHVKKWSQNYKGDKKVHRSSELPASTDTTPRRVNHFELVRSELRPKSGTTISFAVLSEFDLTDGGEKIRRTQSGINPRYIPLDKWELSRLINMRLTGINQCTQSYKENIFESKLPELARLDPELEQRSWDFLTDALSIIRDSLPRNGEYAEITISPKNQAVPPLGEVKIENRGAVNPVHFTEDFRKAFEL
ncbi:hypothetical protein PMAYCL1PPCAC_03266, partial [Pristionchus mayeri]